MSATGGSAFCQQRRTGRVEVDVTAEADVVDRAVRAPTRTAYCPGSGVNSMGGPSPSPASMSIGASSPSGDSRHRPRTIIVSLSGLSMADCVTQHPRTATAPEIWPRTSMRSNTSDK